MLLSEAITFHMPDSMSWAAWGSLIIIAIICLIISAFVSGSEIAFFGLTPAELDELSESEEPGAVKTCNLLSQSERLLATILIANNLVNITMVVVMTFAIGQVMTFNSPIVDFLLQTVFLTFLLLLFGEIFPKLVARGRTMKWVLNTSGILSVLFKLLSPLSKFMVRSTVIINRIVTKKEIDISADELEKALEISDMKEGKDKEMLEGILSFGEKEVSDIMISRVDVTAIEYHDNWEQALQTILKSGYSRIPVYDTSQDTIRGILYSKDLLPHIGKRDNTFHWQTLLREAYFVPESRMIDDLLEDFRKRKIHIAIVVDEYGGTEGIVTLEDIIEEIVGEIDDEYDDTRSVYRKIGPDTYIFDAKASLGDFCHGCNIEEEELGDVGDAETLAGLLLEIKGDFPKKDETFHRGPCTFTVLGMERHRITRVKVVINHQVESE
ncbi:MAG: gliding motility-associated protein GldE [Clostridium sp.]|nr:gliding motility-associated protein GldE [Prevotella sp.]MCM1428394.1 gliding motility-associated protein GldE [Clostridium sp.]MCM1474866.1 gliding motility-associated protein GldE [Muribaculaceae bacterium]